MAIIIRASGWLHCLRLKDTIVFVLREEGGEVVSDLKLLNKNL